MSQEKFTKIVPLAKECGPENVTVTVKGRVMTVEVKTEKKEADGSWSAEGSMNQFTLPSNVDMTKVTSSWTPQGLKVEGPFLDQKQLQALQNSLTKEPPTKWTMNVPVIEGIDAKNLKVIVKDNVMTIEGKTESKKVDDKSSSSSKSVCHQEFSSKVTLPPSVNVNALTSTLSKDGSCLVIEAPYK